MLKQIMRKFDHEKGNLRDKASNIDYRERFQEECGRLERGGTRSNRIVLAEMRNLGVVRRKIMAQDKEKARLVFESRLRSLPLKVNSLTFLFKYSPTSFATANGLPSSPTAQKLLPALRGEAQERLRMTKGRFLAAEPWGREETDTATGKTRTEWFLTFKTFLPTAQTQPWRSFFKRLRLDPVETETQNPST
ncbi:MAG TPA: hypothetical protein VFC44_26600 [Candidatus Saccharimonadales bacterium]|nr:hypothetical protein [Candidatus Saccharimonadales bacterium]